MSGHSKWHTIKHKKGATDAKRGKLFTKLIKELQVAARMGGGDVSANPRLRKAVSDAKGNQMPNDTIKRAIMRGTGELEGTNYEEVLYEGTGPGGTLFMVAGMTVNRNRTVAELRKVYEKHQGNLGGGGTAGWAFDRKGIITVPTEAIDEDQLMEVTMDAGAEDFTLEGDSWQLLCDVSDIDGVVTALEGAEIKVESSGPGYIPKNKKPLTGKDAQRALNLFEALDDHDDSQHVYADFDISDEELGRILSED